MSIQNLLNTQVCAENRRFPSGRSNPEGPSFQEQLAQTSPALPDTPIHLRMPGENTVYSASVWGQNTARQEVYAEYTADSTAGDPIVRITGTSDSGPYDMVCHINNIDPSSASYAELAALYGHLVKTGAYQSVLDGVHKPGVLPHTMEYRGDVTQKHNFLRDIEESLENQFEHLPTAVTGAQELLALYQSYASGNKTSVSRSASSLDHTRFMKEDIATVLYDAKLSMLDRMKKSKDKKEEREEWEKLMKQLDAWIESLREEADIEKIARAYADLKAKEADEKAGRKDLADHILDKLTERLVH